MNSKSTRLMVLFALLGIVCGLALSVLIQPGNAAAQAPQPASINGGLSKGSDPALMPGNGQVMVATPALSPDESSAPAALANRSFTYQGMLRQGGLPVNATCDFQFAAWDSLSGGGQIGSTQSLTSVIANGLFTVLLNTANQFTTAAFDGRAVWIETSVRCPSGSGSFTTLVPRQALTAAPLASGLVSHATIRANDTNSGNAALTIQAPAVTAGNPMGLEAHADPSSIIGIIKPVGIWGDSSTGEGVWGTTDSGNAIYGLTFGSGKAGYFEGDVTVTGKLDSRMKGTQVINSVGPLPFMGATFTSSGGTLLLYYSGSGYSNTAGKMIGMSIAVDGNLIDSTGIYANASLMHLAFVPKQWVLTGIGAGMHSLSLYKMNNDTLTDSNDIFFVTIMELPN
jgi:hypothetical protein